MFKFHKTNISDRGYELVTTAKMVDSIIAWLKNNVMVSSIEQRTITFTDDFPISWSVPQKLLTPIIAEYLFEVFAISQAGDTYANKLFTLNDIARFKKCRKYLPSYMGINTKNITQDGLVWIKYVRDYVPPSLVNEAYLTFIDLKKKSSEFAPNVKDVQKEINKYTSGRKYTVNEVAQALYHAGYRVMPEVSNALGAINRVMLKQHEYPQVPEHYMNVSYSVW